MELPREGSTFLSRLFPEPLPGTGERWAARHVTALLLAVAIGTSLGWLGRQSELLLLGDGPVYLGLSESLEAGRYNDEFLPGTPRHAHYPPGMPLWLLIVRQVGGGDPDVARGANLILLALTAVLIADAMRRITSPWWGVAAGAATITNPALLSLAGTLYAETLFTAGVAVSLWAALLADHRAGRPWRALAFLAAGAAILTRVTGVATVFALWCWTLIRRQYRWVVVGGVLIAIGLGAGVVYVLAPTGNPASRTYFNELRSMGDLGARIVARAVNHVTYYSTSTVPFELGLPTIPNTPVDNLAWYLLLAVLGATGFIVMARAWLPAALNLVAGAGILILWIWEVDRFVSQLLPWIICALLLGARWVSQRLPPRIQPAVAMTLCLFFIGSGATAAFVRSGEERACHLGTRDPSHCPDLEVRAFIDAARFAGTQLPPTAVVISVRPASFYYFSRRQSLPLSVLPEPRERGKEWIGDVTRAGATHLLISRLTSPERDRIVPVLLSGCEQTDAIFTVPRGAILLVPRADTAGAGNGCEGLRQFLGQ